MKRLRSILALAVFLLALPAIGYAALSVNLAWDYTQNPDQVATGFTMERCTGTGCTSFNNVGAGLPLTPLTWSDTNVIYNTTYSYRVRATSAQGGISAPSNVVTFSTPPPEVAAPLNLRGTVTK